MREYLIQNCNFKDACFITGAAEEFEFKVNFGTSDSRLIPLNKPVSNPTLINWAEEFDFRSIFELHGKDLYPNFNENIKPSRYQMIPMFFGIDSIYTNPKYYRSNKIRPILSFTEECGITLTKNSMDVDAILPTDVDKAISSNILVCNNFDDAFIAACTQYQDISNTDCPFIILCPPYDINLHFWNPFVFTIGGDNILEDIHGTISMIMEIKKHNYSYESFLKTKPFAK